MYHQHQQKESYLVQSLGDDWAFHEKCIDNDLDVATNQQNTTAWDGQMHQPIQSNGRVNFSHEGILFLLKDMGIQLPKQRGWGEGEELGKYVSPPLSPPGSFKEPSSTYNDAMAPFTVHLRGTMASRLPRRPLRPNTPSVKTAPRVPAPRFRQQHKQPHSLPDRRHRVLPFDFGAAMQPSLAFPKDLKAFHYPPEQIILTENYVPPQPNPLRKQSSEPVFFIDPAFRQDVAELFGYTVGQDHSRNGNVNTRQVHLRTIGFHTTMRQALPYGPNDGDVLVWRKRSESGSYIQARSDEAEPAWNLSDTWPQWNFREDLELDYDGASDIVT